jgi:serine/threonine protein kinase
MIGSSVGHYRIEAQLGAGGMGVVYRAYDTVLRRRVAIKFLTGLSDDESRTRLLKEARAASALNHPDICTIHEIAEADGQPC